MKKFNKFIDMSKLMEIPLSNGKFIWSREGSTNSQSLLDKFLISNNWDDMFANSRVTRQVRLLSDHFPILLEAGSFEWGLSPFRFCNSWLELKDCCRFVENSLDLEIPQGWAGFILSTQLRKVKEALKKWNMNFERAKKRSEEALLKELKNMNRGLNFKKQMLKFLEKEEIFVCL